MTKIISIGRLIRSSTRGCAVGCLAEGQDLPAFGALVRVPANAKLQIYGLIYDTRVDDDGLVRQLAGAANLPMEVIEDNRRNRNAPVELSVLFVGYELKGEFRYLLPPQPPLSLEEIYPCGPQEIQRFCTGNPAYLRFLISAEEVPAADLAAAHILQAGTYLPSHWKEDAAREWIRLVRDNPALLSASMSALTDIFSEITQGNAHE